MTTLEELNRLLNRALRAANDVAIAIPNSSLSDRKAAVQASVQAVVQLTSVQDLLVKQDPNLEYHYDPNRPASELMKTFAVLFEQVQAHLANGRIADAAQLLRQAQALEPPPLTYEKITRQLDSLKTSG